MLEFNNLNPYVKYSKISEKKDKNSKNVKEKADNNQNQAKNEKTDRYQSPEDVLNFLALNSTYFVGTSKTKTGGGQKINIDKYVTSEQKARITGFINEFEDYIINGMQAMEAELSGIPAYNNLSDSAKLGIAAQAFNKQFME